MISDDSFNKSDKIKRASRFLNKQKLNLSNAKSLKIKLSISPRKSLKRKNNKYLGETHNKKIEEQVHR